MAKFVKTRALLLWAVLNGALPICSVWLFKTMEFGPPVQQNLALLVIVVVLAGNIFGTVKMPEARKYFVTIIALNMLVLVWLSAISFVTALPELPEWLMTLGKFIVQIF